MAPDLMEAEMRQRAEKLLRAFDFARCLEVLRRFGRSAGNAAASRVTPDATATGWAPTASLTSSP